MAYFRARTQNPRVGRFAQRDPLGYGPGPNLYEYVSSSPLTLADPLGANPGVVVLGGVIREAAKELLRRYGPTIVGAIAAWLAIEEVKELPVPTIPDFMPREWELDSPNPRPTTGGPGVPVAPIPAPPKYCWCHLQYRAWGQVPVDPIVGGFGPLQPKHFVEDIIESTNLRCHYDSECDGPCDELAEEMAAEASVDEPWIVLPNYVRVPSGGAVHVEENWCD